jgi:hypothetical protein
MAGHPWFTSGLEWHNGLDEALAEAGAAHKKLMLVFGRAKCAGTRLLVERTLAKEEIEEYTRQHFTMLAVDADTTEPQLTEVLARLPVRAPTPLIAYLSIDARVLGSTAGGRPPAVLLNDMLGATSRP